MSNASTTTNAVFNRKAGATTKTTTDSEHDAPDSVGAGKDASAVLIDIVKEIRDAGAELLMDAALERELRKACDEYLGGKVVTSINIRAILQEHGNTWGSEIVDKLSHLESQIGESQKPSQADTPTQTHQPAPGTELGDASVAAIPSEKVVRT